MITVVIPYFQREPGILRRALTSIAAQRDCPLPIHVLVIDDASPAPPAPEVDATHNMPWTVQVIRQANAGPGGARNTGLASVPSGTRYVAFVDSDDEWSPDHLARAVAALRAGFDLYFADLMQLGAEVSAFARAGRINLARHPSIACGHAGLFAYQGYLHRLARRKRLPARLLLSHLALDPLSFLMLLPNSTRLLLKRV